MIDLPIHDTMASFTSSNTADFSTDQAELLRDLAFGGYHDASFNSRHNAYSNGKPSPLE